MHASLDLLDAELCTALAGLSETQTQLTPTQHPEKWSIQQIADHLHKTYLYTIPVLQTRLDKRSPTKANPSIAQRIVQFTLIKLGRFPTGYLSPAVALPSDDASESGVALYESIHQDLLRLDELLAACTQLFGSTRRAASHLRLGPLSMDQWARFHLIHARHHIRQIQTIRKDHNI